MTNVQEFFAMGGHAAFIWPSYAIVSFVMVVLLVVSYRAYKRAERDFNALEETNPRRRQKSSSDPEPVKEEV